MLPTITLLLLPTKKLLLLLLLLAFIELLLSSKPLAKSFTYIIPIFAAE